MNFDFANIQQQIAEDKNQIASVQDLERLRLKYLAKKGIIAELYAALGSLPPEQKALVGKNANIWRQELEAFIAAKKTDLAKAAPTLGGTAIDVTLPGVALPLGHAHILTTVMEDICAIFEKLGFAVVEGPEMETEFNNFDGLNIPPEHPARDGLDTFYVEIPDPAAPGKKLLLRSQTSPMQIRVMREHQPPLAVVVPGKVYRPDAVDASHSFMFHQIEGLLVDKDVKFSDLKGLLTSFCRKFFGTDIRMRLRPHYFPFTEPSAEVDISCYLCGGKGCSVCGRKGWLEIMGCGMVHPNVFQAVGYPPDVYTGLAFGLGVERIAMLKYGIKDIRLFYDGDERFLRQF
ncbi:MAG: phenylalanine--tRNA ligase subunit alpha [Candidatus Omnitrophica bacterium]|nr:phenylalanine--tRNA ligase subunit alpha [Candidatus Omnitrophota bacterium]